ncbi:virulence protein [Moritella sp. Urea-trap-13]|uniref:virulence protein n=1 Tax=Moritella sp. Urea-trap-13 TaxID=2058327 RepID=UPI000C32DA56|nr:virulence protein [Moritella sp. Urea-trap-13]
MNNNTHLTMAMTALISSSFSVSANDHLFTSTDLESTNNSNVKHIVGIEQTQVVSTTLTESESELLSAAEYDRYERNFPIWAQEAIDLGHELPKPYGFSMTYMKMEQPLVVDSVAFSGIGPIIDDRVKVGTSTAQQESETLTLRGDVWVLPFLNVYGILGYTQGSSTAMVSPVVDWWIRDPKEYGPYAFELNFKGITYGAGTTIVGGIDNWFALLDVNYTNTALDILDGEISSIVVSPRVGYRWKFKGHDMQLWTGAMYQNVEQTFEGNLSDIGVNLPGRWGNGKFKVEQHLEDKWNTLIGGQAQITNNVDLLMEAGVGTRRSMMVSLGYRF